MRTGQKLLSIIMALCLCMGMFPAVALAADGVGSEEALKTAVAGNEEEIVISGTIALTGDLEIPTGRSVTLVGEDSEAKIALSGQNSILVKGELTLKNLAVEGAMSPG